ncbi:S-layer homology domain-containing protein, partial [[Eubacterium] yurii]
MNFNQKQIKKRLSMILSLLLIISSVNISSAAKTRFADVPDTHWASKVIAKWSGEDYKVLQGDGKGNFNPSKGLTLGEFMTIISKTFGYVQKQETQVTPVWAKESVEKAIAAGILPKTEKIDANKMITRQEAIKYIAIAFGIQSSQGNTAFIDDQDIDAQYKPYIKAFYDMGYITGDNKDKSKAKFNPKAYYTRAEAMQVIDNILSDIIDRYTRDQTYEKNIIIRKAGVNLHNIKVKQNIIIAQGVQDSNISIDKVQIGKSLIIYGGKDISAISDKMIENTIINRPYKSVTLRGKFNTITIHDKTTVHIIGKAEKIIL